MSFPIKKSGLDLIDVNPAIGKAINVINPLAAQVDASLFKSFGLGDTEHDLKTRLTAAMQLNPGLNITNPYEWLQQVLAGILQFEAQIKAALALPPFEASFTPELAANAAIIADLKLRLGAIQAMIDALIKVKTPAVGLAGELEAKLKVGPVTIMAWTGETLPSVASQLTSPPTAPPGVSTHGISIYTESPEAWKSMQYLFKTDQSGDT